MQQPRASSPPVLPATPPSSAAPTSGLALLLQPATRMQSISEATAVRLFNSVVATDQPGGSPSLAAPITDQDQAKSLFSIHSSNEFGHSCRICRFNRSEMQILSCPCLCKGSVGFIHLHCLKRWIIQRRDRRCEICNTTFDIARDKFNVRRMLCSFFCQRCFGTIAKHLLFSASLVPLAYVILQQVLLCMDRINFSTNDKITAKEVLLASCTLLTSSALFFNFFEYITTRFILIRNILRQWWMFGGSGEYSLIEIDSEPFEF